MAVSLERFAEQLAESGLLTESQTRAFLESIPPAERPTDGEQLARRLVRERKISGYQAQTVYSGKGKTLTMGSYFVLDKLGQGGMGMVLKAEHRMMKRQVAIKVLSPTVTKTKELQQRFQREVEAAARLTHPNIVGAFDAGESHGSPFLVMEYVPGSDLASIVKTKGTLPVDQAIDCILQAARGLEFAHSQGVIHRDIKPANLLLDTKGVVKILDMGLARIEATEVATQADLTGTGAVMGTVDYMAPEQALSTKQADARSDLYSLGISLWFLLTGKPAYEGDSLMARLLAHREQQIPGLRTARADVPESLDHVFQKLVAKKPADRYQTATELIADLQACRTGASVKAMAVAEVSTGTDDFQDFLNVIHSPTETLPPGKKRPAALTATRKLAGAEATMSGGGETVSQLRLNRPRRAGKQAAPLWFRDRRVLAGAGAAAAILLLAVIFLVQTPSGTLRVEILDPTVEMTVKGTDLKFHGTDLEPVTLSAGGKTLKVVRGDLSFETELFEIRKGTETRVKAELIGDKLVVNSGENVIGEGVVPRRTVTATTTGAMTKPADGAANVKMPAVTPPIPAEALEFEGHRYLLVEDFGTWREADAKARARGGHLATINSPAERDWMLENVWRKRPLQSESGCAVFLGGHVVDGEWKWVTKEPFDASLFRQPPLITPKAGLSWTADTTWSGNDADDSNARFQYLAVEWDSTPGGAGQVVAWQGWPVDAPKPAIAPFDAAQARTHQEAWATYLQTPVEYTNSIGMKFRLIPPGEFPMGSSTAELEAILANSDKGDLRLQEILRSEGPQHRVILTRPIYLGMHEVTQSQYETMMGTNPSHFGPSGPGKDAVTGLNTAALPVEMVSWNDAAQFCVQLSEQEKRKPFYARSGDSVTSLPGTGYRLPTEAEWEFACRAGTVTRYWIGDRDEDVTLAGWNGGNSGGRTHAGGELKANPFGLFDVHGNVFEWVQDGWGATQYSQYHDHTAVNPDHPMSSGFRAMRGGDWFNVVTASRSSIREASEPTRLHQIIGFRVVLAVTPSSGRLPTPQP